MPYVARLVAVTTVLCFGSPVLTSAGGEALEASGNPSASPCTRSAHDMLSACISGVRSDLYTTQANCRNFADSADRSACFEEARQSRREDAESCRDVLEARLDACDLLSEHRYSDPLADPGNTFIDPNDVPGVYAENPYVSLAAGHTYLLRAGEDGEETVVVHVAHETRDILGIACRVVLDVVLEVDDDGEYEAVEVTDDWFAQDEAGNVYYCGEISRNFEDGTLTDIEGSFEAGVDFAKAGELIRVFPAAEEAHRTEYALGEAEDIIRYLDTMTEPGADEGGDNAVFPCAPNMCLKTFDFSPLEPESTEYKYYLPGTGFVLAVALEDGEITGEREELVCVGDSLDVLGDPACEIADPVALREELCSRSPAFCE
jgi:hypothetical protein